MGTLQSNPANATPVWIAPAPGGLVKNLATDATTLVKTGAGVFSGITVNTVGVGSTARVYDGLDAGGTLLGTFSTTALGTIQTGWNFLVGLCVVTAGGTPADITISYL